MKNDRGVRTWVTPTVRSLATAPPIVNTRYYDVKRAREKCAATSSRHPIKTSIHVSTHLELSISHSFTNSIVKQVVIKRFAKNSPKLLLLFLVYGLKIVYFGTISNERLILYKKIYAVWPWKWRFNEQQRVYIKNLPSVASLSLVLKNILGLERFSWKLPWAGYPWAGFLQPAFLKLQFLRK